MENSVRVKKLVVVCFSRYLVPGDMNAYIRAIREQSRNIPT